MAFSKIKKVLTISRKQFPVIIFFVMIHLLLTVLSYLDNITECFPVTVITVEEEVVKSVLSREGVCESDLFSEKMTFDSSIFNHYETPPVKEIFFLTVKLPYTEWDSIVEAEEATVEANPFVESLVKSYYLSRLKWLTISFIVVFVLGLFLFAASIPSKTQGFEIFKPNTSLTVLIFLSGSFSVISRYPAGLMMFSGLSLLSVLMVYIMFLVLYSRFVLEEKQHEKRIRKGTRQK
jgi:hypothetical protein